MNKKHLLKVLVLSFFTLIFCAGTVFAQPQVSAKSAILMVLDTNEILFEKNAHARMPMASTTKIMTSLIALESRDLIKEIEIDKNMLLCEGSSMGLLPEDKVTLKTLVCGMLLKSGNDAADAAAIFLGGSKENFALMMNERAKKIKMYNTNFETPSGLDSKNHYSTAYDMALLGCEAMKNPEFSYICSQKEMSVYYGNPPYLRKLKNHNKLLWSYEGAMGVKTGFTKKSGRCLVSCAQKNGIRLIAVTLNAPNDWQDHRKMLDYGFSIVKRCKTQNDDLKLYLNIVGSPDKRVRVEPQKDPAIAERIGKETKIKKKIFIKRFEYAPIEKGAVVGKIDYYLENKLICSVPLLTAQGAN